MKKLLTLLPIIIGAAIVGFDGSFVLFCAVIPTLFVLNWDGLWQQRA